jgi:hypothetical protein
LNGQETQVRVLLTFSMFGFATAAMAGPQCTQEPKTKWQLKDEVQKIAVQTGYKVDVFKVTDGNCYELYGRDKAGKRVEIYYHPITAEVVKKRVR